MATPGASAARYDEWADWYETYMQGAAQDFTRRTSDALVQVLGRGSGPGSARPTCPWATC